MVIRQKGVLNEEFFLHFFIEWYVMVSLRQMWNKVESLKWMSLIVGLQYGILPFEKNKKLKSKTKIILLV